MAATSVEAFLTGAVKTFAGWLAFGAVCFVGFYIVLGTEWGFLRSEVSAFQVNYLQLDFRPELVTNKLIRRVKRANRSATDEQILAIIKNEIGGSFFQVTYTFKVVAEQQKVVYWADVPGIRGGATPVAELSGCSVRNRTNWTCRTTDGQGTQGFRAGAYFNTARQTPEPGKVEETYYVSRFHAKQLQLGMYEWTARRPKPLFSMSDLN